MGELGNALKDIQANAEKIREGLTQPKFPEYQEPPGGVDPYASLGPTPVPKYQPEPLKLSAGTKTLAVLGSMMGGSQEVWHGIDSAQAQVDRRNYYDLQNQQQQRSENLRLQDLTVKSRQFYNEQQQRDYAAKQAYDMAKYGVDAETYQRGMAEANRADIEAAKLASKMMLRWGSRTGGGGTGKPRMTLAEYLAKNNGARAQADSFLNSIKDRPIGEQQVLAKQWVEDRSKDFKVDLGSTFGSKDVDHVAALKGSSGRFFKTGTEGVPPEISYRERNFAVNADLYQKAIEQNDVVSAFKSNVFDSRSKQQNQKFAAAFGGLKAIIDGREDGDDEAKKRYIENMASAIEYFQTIINSDTITDQEKELYHKHIGMLIGRLESFLPSGRNIQDVVELHPTTIKAGLQPEVVLPLTEIFSNPNRAIELAPTKLRITGRFANKNRKGRR